MDKFNTYYKIECIFNRIKKPMNKRDSANYKWKNDHIEPYLASKQLINS